MLNDLIEFGQKKVITQRAKPRLIIVRFISMRKRMEVYKNKKNLQSQAFLITESLTLLQYERQIFAKVDNQLQVLFMFFLVGALKVYTIER